MLFQAMEGVLGGGCGGLDDTRPSLAVQVFTERHLQPVVRSGGKCRASYAGENVV